MEKHILKTTSIFGFSDTNNQIYMSRLFNEIANECFEGYYKKLNMLTKSFNVLIEESIKSLDSIFEQIQELNIDYSHLNENNMIKKNNFVFKDVLSMPNEVTEITSFLKEQIDLNGIKPKHKVDLDMSKEYLDTNDVMKSGVKALAFEAFACEALINENLKLTLSNNQINKLERNSKIIGKLEKLIEIKIGESPKPIEFDTNRVKALMNRRNNIAHYKQFSVDLNAFFRSIETFANPNEVQNLRKTHGDSSRVLNSPLV